MNAMIFAAGLGTRLRPLTDHCPKALVPIAGKPMLEQVILRLRAAGFDHIVVNVHHYGEQIIDFLHQKQNFGIHIDVSDERDCLLDTGGGIKKAASFFRDGTPFLVHNVDIMTNLDLKKFYDSHTTSGALATLLVSKRSTSRYLLLDEAFRLCGWMNKNTGETKSPYAGFSPGNYREYAFDGIHVLSPEVFERMEAWEQKFSVIDFYLQEAAGAKIIGNPAPADLWWMDIGKPEALLQAEAFLKNSGR